MSDSVLYSYLHINFSTEEASIVLSALRQDQMVWQNVQDKELLGEFTGEGVESREDLSPGRLALIVLGHGEYLPLMRDRAQFLVDDTLQKRANRFLKSVYENGRQVTHLEKAGLAAVALREQWRLSQSWKEVFTKAQFFNAEAVKPDTWRTPLACLFGMVPDGMHMLDVLSEFDGEDKYLSIVSHVLLSNPILDEERQNQFLKLLERKRLPSACTTLRGLVVLGEEGLAKKLAENLLEAHQDECNEAKSVWSTMDGAQLLTCVGKLQSLAGLCQMCGKTKKAAFLIDAVEKATRFWRGGLHLQGLAAADKMGKADQYVKKSVSNSNSRIVIAQPELSYVSDAAIRILDDIPLTELHPFLQLRKAYQLKTIGEMESAKAIAQTAVQELVEMVGKQEKVYAPKFIAQWDPMVLIDILESLDMQVEALQVAHILQQERPNDIKLMHYLSDYLEKTDDLSAASQYAFAAAIINPRKAENFKRLARLQEQQEQWKDAYDSWAQVIRLMEDPAAADWVKFGLSAYKSDMPRIAAKACESALAKEAKSEKANALMGKVLQHLEDYETSIPFLIEATKIGPGQAEHWLRLAHSYEALDLMDHAISTLQAGYKTLPESSEINFSLGKVLKENGNNEKSLAFFKAAVALNPEFAEAAYQLAANLVDLEEHEQAKDILITAVNKWPKYYPVARLLAELSVQSRDYVSAIPALEAVIDADDAPDELKLAYVEAIFKGQDPLVVDELEVESKKLQRAESLLEEVLEASPRLFEAELAYAEVLGVRGRNQEALLLFRKLIESAHVTLPEWRWRLFADMGAVADGLEKKDIALAAMKEAAQAAPDRLDVMKKLAKVYVNADLPDEAYQTVKTVRNMAPDEIDVLVWYVDISTQTGHFDEALDALVCATEIAAEAPELWVRLAELQSQVGESKAVQESLKHLEGIKDVPATLLQKASHLYISQGELQEALTCLSRIDFSLNNDPAMLFDRVSVQARCGYIEEAESNMHQLLALYPENVCIHMLQTDMLASLGRVQGALANLQHAESGSEKDRHFPFSSQHIQRVLPEDWYCSLTAPEAIDLRMGVLHETTGDSKTALSYFEKAISLNKSSAKIRFMAAELANALLETKKIPGILSDINEFVVTDEETLAAMPLLEKQAREGLFALRASYGLRKGEKTEIVDEAIVNGLRFDPEHSSLLALQSQSLVQKGEYTAAEEAYQKALNGFGRSGRKQTAPLALWGASTNPPKKFSSVPGISLAEAALALGKWQDAIRISEDLVENHPNENRALLHQASLIVRLHEANLAAKDLKIRRHVPDQKALGFAAEERFNDLMNRLENMCRCEETARWAARGNMVFRNSMDVIRDFSKSAKYGEDLGALVAALRRSRNVAGAVQHARKHMAEPKVLMEYGLSVKESNPDEAIAVLTKATALQPKNPLAHAALAVVTQQAGELEYALKEVEKSLEIWGDEPEWHAWAANLAAKDFAWEKAIQHLEKAVDLESDNLEYKLALGEAQIQNGEAGSAIDLLEGLDKKAKEKGKVWMLLSKAYMQHEDWNKALQASEHAAAVDRYSPEPVLQSGKIALKLGKSRKAMECARLALKRAPDAAGSLLFLCDVQKAAGKSIDALCMLEEAIKGGQNAPDVMLEHARLVRSIHGAKETEPLLQSLTKLDPENAKALSELAEVQKELGKQQEASLHAFRALKLEPTLKGLNSLLGTLKRADGQLDQAVYYYSEAIRQYPDDLETYVALGETYVERRENQKALHIFEQAMEIAPEDSRLFYQAGVILRDQKDYIGAEDMMRRASELDPGNVNIRRQLGAIVALNLIHNPRGVKS